MLPVSKISADVRDGVPINQAKIDARKYFQTIQTASVYYTYSATNVRLGELSLSYTLPKKWFANKLGMTVGLGRKESVDDLLQSTFRPGTDYLGCV